jgi:hypothetical protein
LMIPTDSILSAILLDMKTISSPLIYPLSVLNIFFTLFILVLINTNGLFSKARLKVKYIVISLLFFIGILYLV